MERLEDRFEPGALPRAHAHFLDDEIAEVGLKSFDGRRAPGPAHHRLVLGKPLEQRRIQRDTGRARLDDEPDMNDGNPMRARRRRDVANVFDHVLRFRVRGRAGCGESPALAHRVVLHVLNDEDGAMRVEIEPRRRLAGADALIAAACARM